MPSSELNWKSLYKLQDKILHTIKNELGSFYLTGGTALSRYYLNHRCSEDLDFFCHKEDEFGTIVDDVVRSLVNSNMLDQDMVQKMRAYVRMFVGPSSELKIEFVYEKFAHVGDYKIVDGIKIDNPKNILANKICCVVGRDEPKDVFDIVSIAEAYSFNWKEIIRKAKRKQILNETEVALRLEEFPIQLLKNINWAICEINLQNFDTALNQIIKDILLGGDNSLGVQMPPLPG